MSVNTTAVYRQGTNASCLLGEASGNVYIHQLKPIEKSIVQEGRTDLDKSRLLSPSGNGSADHETEPLLNGEAAGSDHHNYALC